MTSQSLVNTLHVDYDRFNQCVVAWKIPYDIAKLY